MNKLKEVFGLIYDSIRGVVSNPPSVDRAVAGISSAIKQLQEAEEAHLTAQEDAEEASRAAAKRALEHSRERSRALRIRSKLSDIVS